MRVHFKRRENGQQDVLIISIASRDDGEGRIEQWGLLDATGKFVRTGPNRVDLADIHLSMTTTDSRCWRGNRQRRSDHGVVGRLRKHRH